MMIIVLEFAFAIVLDVNKQCTKTFVSRNNFAFSDTSQITESPLLAVGHLLMSHAQEVVQSLLEILCGMYKH